MTTTPPRSPLAQSAHWDARYSREDYVFGEAPNGFLESCAPLLNPGWKALAVADGEGRNGVWLAEQGLDVLSVDYSTVALEKAEKLAKKRNVTLRTAQVDLLHWDWPEAAFDLVVAIFIQFTGPEGRNAMFAGMKKALKPGGMLLLEGYRPEQIGCGTGGPGSVENLYTEEMLRADFADFEILSLVSHDPMIDEGPGHSGPSAVIDLVARKP